MKDSGTRTVTLVCGSAQCRGSAVKMICLIAAAPTLSRAVGYRLFCSPRHQRCNPPARLRYCAGAKRCRTPGAGRLGELSF